MYLLFKTKIFYILKPVGEHEPLHWLISDRWLLRPGPPNTILIFKLMMSGRRPNQRKIHARPAFKIACCRNLGTTYCCLKVCGTHTNLPLPVADMGCRIEALFLCFFAVFSCAGVVLGAFIRYNTSGGTVPGKLNVHLVAHSHDDVGWLKTVDQYFVGSNNSIQVCCTLFCFFVFWILRWFDDLMTWWTCEGCLCEQCVGFYGGCFVEESG